MCRLPDRRFFWLVCFLSSQPLNIDCVEQHTKQKRFCESKQYFVSSLDALTDFWGLGFSWLILFPIKAVKLQSAFVTKFTKMQNWKI